MKHNLPKYTQFYGFTKEQILALREAPYEKALHIKVDAANELAKRLLAVPFMEQDTNRINKVIKARKFNMELLTELKD